MVKDREPWHAAVHGWGRSVGHNLATKQQQKYIWYNSWSNFSKSASQECTIKKKKNLIAHFIRQIITQNLSGL